MIVEDLIRCFDRTTAYLLDLVQDLSDQDLTVQPPGAPNHAAWTLGHVIHSWQAIAEELGVRPWLPDDWESLFAYGSDPGGVAGSPYSSKRVLAACFAEARDRLRAALAAGAAQRWREPLPGVESREVFATTGDALLQVVLAHTAYHAGQLAAWRRAIGRAPVGVFI